MAIARSTGRAKAWKWSIAGGSVAAFLAMAQFFHVGDASRPSTPVAAIPAAQTTQTAYGGATMVCVAGAYGYTCTPVARYSNAGYGGGTASTGGGYASAFANTRSSGS